ncbi:MAG: M23 family metallopeptidase [Tepidanaerobacteraceae bacterium]|jgi:murein DD-endopeptidase|nr:M23 family metallopeptidase [Thermoanaerobacterales bacterium]
MYYYDQPSDEKWPRPGDLKKAIICVLIIIAVLFMKKIELPIVKSALTKIDFVVSDYSYEFNDILAAIKEIPGVPDSIAVFSHKEQVLFELPVNGTISSGYGMRFHPILKEQRFHNGIDIVQIEGAPVKVVLDGVVHFVGKDDELGNVVKIKHGGNITTVYAHLRDIYVKEQEALKQGFIIGTVGKTGLAETSHLHFEVWQNDNPKDPMEWIISPQQSQEGVNGSENI